MGTFNVALQVRDRSGERWEWVEALVDMGASYTVLPAHSAYRPRPGIDPTFSVRTGRWAAHRARDDGGRVRYGDVDVTTLVVLGDASDGALFGAYTLEGLGFAVDPVNRRLVPMTGLLMTSILGA